nr:MAG TPA: CRISPR-associated endonuclease [Caudoviricetes sp.]
MKKNCDNCENCGYIGDGDYVCIATENAKYSLHFCRQKCRFGRKEFD